MSLKLDSAVDLPLRLLKDSGPSAVSIELTNLAPDGGGSSTLLLAFIQMIDSMLASGRDFDLAQGYLALFLKVRTHLSSDFAFCCCCNLHTFCCFFPASPPAAVPGLCCHGSLAPPLFSVGRRVGGTTGII